MLEYTILAKSFDAIQNEKPKFYIVLNYTMFNPNHRDMFGRWIKHNNNQQNVIRQ